jgi:2-polyprenyl-3-methyl-5-hydroxy-6-metoxy-1,4-benzoquinol methylase
VFIVTLITDDYCKLNAEMHKLKPHYGVSGEKYANQVHALALALQTEDILDYGCGKSTLAQNLPYKIKQYDPAIPKHSALPKPADMVVCTDVLEHIEPEMLGEVLDHLKSLVKCKGFFIIATRPANKHLPDGRNAHLIIEDARWWLNALWDRFKIVGFQDRGEEFLARVEAK